MITEKSCGGIVFRNGKYLLIKHKEENGGHWHFPKGHVEEGESEEDTALREIYEETGLKVKIIDGFKESISYFSHINKVNRTIVFFLCKSNSSEVNLGEDEEDYTWLNFEDSLKKLTYDETRILLKKANSFLK